MNNYLAQITNKALNESLQSQTGGTFLGNLLSTLVTLLIIIGVVSFVFMLLLGGIQWITSSGDKAGVEAAKGRVSHALIGLVVLFCVFAVIQVVQSVFGINILSVDLDPLGVQ